MKSRSLIALLSATSLLLSGTAVAQPSRTDKAELSHDNARVRDLFRQGSKAFEGGKYEEARRLLEEAWALRKTYDIAASLAQVENELGHRARSAEYLDFCLQNFAPAESEQTLQEIQKAFDDVRRQIAVLHVSVNREGAEVLVGERVVGRSPLASDVFVEPGSQGVRARFDGREATKTLIAEAGGQYSLELELTSESQASSPAPAPAPALAPAPAPAAPASTPATPPQDAVRGDGQKSMVPVIVGGSVFVLTLGTGLGFHLSAGADAEQADSTRKRTGPNGCAAGSNDDCQALQDLAESQDRNRNLSTVSFVVAGAALVATGVYWFWPRSPDTKLAAVAAPGQAGVILSGTF